MRVLCMYVSNLYPHPVLHCTILLYSIRYYPVRKSAIPYRAMLHYTTPDSTLRHAHVSSRLTDLPRQTLARSKRTIQLDTTLHLTAASPSDLLLCQGSGFGLETGNSQSSLARLAWLFC